MSENLAIFFLLVFRQISAFSAELRFGFLIKLYIDYSGLIIFLFIFTFLWMRKCYTFPEILVQWRFRIMNLLKIEGFF